MHIACLRLWSSDLSSGSCDQCSKTNVSLCSPSHARVSIVGCETRWRKLRCLGMLSIYILVSQCRKGCLRCRGHLRYLRTSQLYLLSDGRRDWDVYVSSTKLDQGSNLQCKEPRRRACYLLRKNVKGSISAYPFLRAIYRCQRGQVQIASYAPHGFTSRPRSRANLWLQIWRSIMQPIHHRGRR